MYSAPVINLTHKVWSIQQLQLAGGFLYYSGNSFFLQNILLLLNIG